VGYSFTRDRRFAAGACAAKNFLIFEMNCELFQILLLPIHILNMHQPVFLCNTWLDWYLCLKHKKNV
jgi:hypothetical protein